MEGGPYSRGMLILYLVDRRLLLQVGSGGGGGGGANSMSDGIDKYTAVVSFTHPSRRINPKLLQSRDIVSSSRWTLRSFSSSYRKKQNVLYV